MESYPENQFFWEDFSSVSFTFPKDEIKFPEPSPDIEITNSLKLVKYLEEVQKPGVARLVVSHYGFVKYVNKIFQLKLQNEMTKNPPEDTWKDILMDFKSSMPFYTYITGCTHSPLTHVFDRFTKHVDT